MWAVVFAVGVPAAWRNPTAGALVLAKIIGWAIYNATGNSLPIEYYLYPDIFVLAIIATKDERTTADWTVVAIFLLMWATYVAAIHDYYRWWILYWLVIAQFLAVGWDFIFSFRRTRAVIERPDNSDSPGTLLVACEGGGYG